MTDDPIVCANPACRISETGKCIEGLALSECAQYGREPKEEDTAPSILAELLPRSESLPSGDALSIERAASLLVERESRVITIIGPRETGKTSLVAGLYDLFQTGPIGEISFARSCTLQAFEMACHDARQASRRKTPHMERTGRGEVRFYHLDLKGGLANIRLSLLIADRSGEEYSDVADDIAAATDLLEVRRADSITFLIDGARLLNSGLRHNIKNDVIMIMQGLIESGTLSSDKRIAIVLTKLDLIGKSDHVATVDRDFDGFCSHLAEIMKGRIGRIEKFRIAASPEDGVIRRGAGIDALLNFWLEDESAIEVIPQSIDRPKRAMARIKPLYE
jgi:hypothetical protein